MQLPDTVTTWHNDGRALRKTGGRQVTKWGGVIKLGNPCGGKS